MREKNILRFVGRNHDSLGCSSILEAEEHQLGSIREHEQHFFVSIKNYIALGRRFQSGLELLLGLNHGVESCVISIFVPWVAVDNASDGLEHIGQFKDLLKLIHDDRLVEDMRQDDLLAAIGFRNDLFVLGNLLDYEIVAIYYSIWLSSFSVD